ncbi:glycosyltransferase family 4 protein [Anabaena sp. FACHB-1237]|uniref:glycosyltransferase family 4 protein n=1 Tax=Anabaena sp. FACHB-1237 TaxID=2692769 RepID=UPI001681BFB9|nr:glycosyltransferase family 4 protein [Anabaena sp. FACHB-1237]MBD2138683.1 glycosyltransferase family 4 protein [Anabaena sp. FACHB-1237]
MENISQIGLEITEKLAYPDILVISRVFQPQDPVISEYVYSRCLQDPDRVILLASNCAGNAKFDQSSEFPIYRWPCFHYFCNYGFCNFFRSTFNVIFSFILAIKLYYRYHYRYIEWCHGDDFPALLLLSYILPIRFFIYLHGSDLLSINNKPFWRSLFKLTLKRAEGIVCRSSHTHNFLKNSLRLDTPTHIINPIVRPERFENSKNQHIWDNLRQNIRENYHIPETAVVILSIGKLVKSKNFDRVIDNIPLLLTIGIDVHSIIIGEGRYESELKSQAERLRIDNRVHFAGDISPKELASYYAACDIFAMLNGESSENQNIQNIDNGEVNYLEASYFGRPIIASRLGSLLDIIHHGKNGLLVNQNSGYEVFLAFKKLCQDQELREKLGRQGQELVKRKTYHRWLYNSEK